MLPWPAAGTLAEMLAAVEAPATAALVRKALLAHRNDPALAAQSLGLAPRRFAAILREHHIPLEEA